MKVSAWIQDQAYRIERTEEIRIQECANGILAVYACVESSTPLCPDYAVGIEIEPAQ